jgi:hypothetical protein
VFGHWLHHRRIYRLSVIYLTMIFQVQRLITLRHDKKSVIFGETEEAGEKVVGI